MPRSDRGPNARKAVTVLLGDEERDEIQEMLDDENRESGRDLGLGSKLRELGLVWARGKKRDAGAKSKRRP